MTHEQGGHEETAHSAGDNAADCHRRGPRLRFCDHIVIFAPMKNIVFDLGRVVFAQDPAKCSDEFKRFFSYVIESPMPQFWIDYDLGKSSFDKMISDLSAYRGVDEKYARRLVMLSIEKQEAIVPTESLIHDLKAAGYRLYVLSNMSREYIDFLRQTDVYRYFDGDVVSCEEHVVKPMSRIYDILLDRFALEPAETLFIDDRKENTIAAEAKGIVPFHFDKHDADGSCARLRGMLLSTN